MEEFQQEMYTQQHYLVHPVGLAHELGRVRAQNLDIVRIRDLVAAGKIIILHRMFPQPNRYQMVFRHLQYFPAINSLPFPDNRI